MDKYKQIKEYVVKIIEHNSSYGVMRIKKALKNDFGISVGRDQLAKLLIYWGLGLKRNLKKKEVSMIQKILIAMAGRANLLIRTLITEPFKAISSDITELKYKGGKAYLCVHKDVFGQMVYGYQFGLTMSKELVISSYHNAVKRIETLAGKMPEGMLCHQDQGSQYTSYDYVEKVQEKMILSYSNPGTPTHNPGQESFFGRFKDEWKSVIAEIETYEELEKFVSEKIKYYNEDRIHTSIDYMKPLEFTKSFLKIKKNSSAI